LALHEPHGSFELEHVAAAAERTSSGFRLHGHKSAVLDAQNADLVIIAARCEAELILLAASKAALQGRVRAEVNVDETQRSARIALDGLTLPASAELGGGSDARAALDHAQRVAWLLVAADAAGGAEGVMQLTLDYLRTRKQFGKPIGSYQALKHPMVEIMCLVEEGRSLLYHAATLFDEDTREREIALRMAKTQLCETYAHAADRAVQFHGGIGFTYECHAQLYLRRAQQALHLYGDALHQHRKLCELLF
jgi:alkylation response protein AidB-like acyl-CoA dehydrogenase